MGRDGAARHGQGCFLGQLRAAVPRAVSAAETVERQPAKQTVTAECACEHFVPAYDKVGNRTAAVPHPVFYVNFPQNGNTVVEITEKACRYGIVLNIYS